MLWDWIILNFHLKKKKLDSDRDQVSCFEI